MIPLAILLVSLALFTPVMIVLAFRMGEEHGREQAEMDHIQQLQDDLHDRAGCPCHAIPAAVSEPAPGEMGVCDPGSDLYRGAGRSICSGGKVLT